MSGLHSGSFIIVARVFNLSWASSRCWEVYQEDYFQILVVVAWEGFTSIAINKSHWETTSRSTPDPDPVVIVWEEYPRPLLMKAIAGSHSLPKSSGGSMKGVSLIAINESHW